MKELNDKEKTWENLKRDYMTTDQKLDFIRKYNRERSDIEWAEMVKALKGIDPEILDSLLKIRKL